jgi:hypothetical protein
VTGQAHAPASIGVGGLQTFVLTLTPSAAFGLTDVQCVFDCVNTVPVTVTSGLNTLLLSAATSPVPDIVALAATVGNTGIVSIPGVTATGAFAVATVNVGAGSSITVSADAGSLGLPVEVTVCQTDPATGQCTSAIAVAVTTQISAGATPTFGVFVRGFGSIPFDPATNRCSCASGIKAA